MSAIQPAVRQDERLPPLGNFAYQPQRFLETDSKMSSVLLAHDRRQRPVVLKIAKVEQAARADVNRQAITTTVQWLTELGAHRGLIGLHPISRTDQPRWRSRNHSDYLGRLDQWAGQPEFLVMEHLAGGSLSDFVGHQRLPVAVALRIAHSLARSLAYIHQRQCVHRDLKPENILFRSLPSASSPSDCWNQAFMPILIDFGVAAKVGTERLVSGSRLWMAPELQLAYERRPLHVDPAWDIYALGLIACYMLSGLLPRRRSYDFASYEHYRMRVFRLLSNEIKTWPSEHQQAGQQLQELLAATLAKDSANRPSAHLVAQQTAQILAQIGSPMPRRQQWLMQLEERNLTFFAQPRRLSIVIGTFVLCLLTILLVWQNGWLATNTSEAATSDEPATPHVSASPTLVRPTDTTPTLPTQLPALQETTDFAAPTPTLIPFATPQPTPTLRSLRTSTDIATSTFVATPTLVPFP